jgi:hypothetical protein
MRIRNRIVALGTALVLTGSLLAIALPQPASASIAFALCTYPPSIFSPPACMNRNGGRDGPGTKVIGWNQDFDNNEDFQTVKLTSWCNNGHVTETCPFTVGSGLNARYNTDLIVFISDYAGYCIGSNSTWTQAILNGCLPNGGAFVVSNTNGQFLIDVGVSNHWYANGAPANHPYWLVWDGTFGDQLNFSDIASNSWACYGTCPA